VLHAQERDAPTGRAPLQWKLITNLPVRSKANAVEEIDWYAMRWKIETFHKILKSGCRAEDSQLRTADRLTNLIAIFCILSWRNRRIGQFPTGAQLGFAHPAPQQVRVDAVGQ